MGLIIRNEKEYEVKIVQVWRYRYGKNEIEVRNGISHGSDLYVNGQVQLQENPRGGIASSVELKGKLESGEDVRAMLVEGFLNQNVGFL